MAVVNGGSMYRKGEEGRDWPLLLQPWVRRDVVVVRLEYAAAVFRCTNLEHEPSEIKVVERRRSTENEDERGCWWAAEMEMNAAVGGGSLLVGGSYLWWWAAEPEMKEASWIWCRNGDEYSDVGWRREAVMQQQWWLRQICSSTSGGDAKP